jgi:hypothetical protein
MKKTNKGREKRIREEKEVKRDLFRRNKRKNK